MYSRSEEKHKPFTELKQTISTIPNALAKISSFAKKRDYKNLFQYLNYNDDYCFSIDSEFPIQNLQSNNESTILITAVEYLAMLGDLNSANYLVTVFNAHKPKIQYGKLLSLNVIPTASLLSSQEKLNVYELIDTEKVNVKLFEDALTLIQSIHDPEFRKELANYWSSRAELNRFPFLNRKCEIINEVMVKNKTTFSEARKMLDFSDVILHKMKTIDTLKENSVPTDIIKIILQYDSMSGYEEKISRLSEKERLLAEIEHCTFVLPNVTGMYSTQRGELIKLLYDKSLYDNEIPLTDCLEEDLIIIKKALQMFWDYLHNPSQNKNNLLAIFCNQQIITSKQRIKNLEGIKDFFITIIFYLLFFVPLLNPFLPTYLNASISIGAIIFFSNFCDNYRVTPSSTLTHRHSLSVQGAYKIISVLTYIEVNLGCHSFNLYKTSERHHKFVSQESLESKNEEKSLPLTVIKKSVCSSAGSVDSNLEKFSLFSANQIKKDGAVISLLYQRSNSP